VKTAPQERAIGLTSREVKARLSRRARRAGVDLPPGLGDGLTAYLELLARWNRKINLTSLPLSEPTDETFDRLLIEPLVAARYLPSRNCRVIDIGSGGGSPAIPLKLAAPQISLRMVESKTRKAAFLREAVRQLALGEVTVETSRFEELLAEPDLHEAHDVATLRAVRIEPRTLATLQSLLKPGGLILLFRGSSSKPDQSSTWGLFTIESTPTLVESLGSRLTILSKVPLR
jgi:16S rRNA (guanine527-N7)-methyltransferase